jgi:acetolactate synthase I/II/III large subunit
MNGAESLVRTLVAGGVNVCFTNPGTSEMHFVAALDSIPGMRCVLGLFEGVVTGAADGYYRITDQPAATLLHLGPGLGNGLANLHNAKKANSGMVNIVGEHAREHIKYNAPLTSDIEGIARPMSHWVRTAQSSESVAADGAAAIHAARRSPGQIATLILPADTAWNAASSVAQVAPDEALALPTSATVQAAARALSQGSKAMLLLGGRAVRGRALELAGRIAAKTGCLVSAEYGNARLERGAGRVALPRIPYVVDAAVKTLKDVQQLVLVGSRVPVSFFAYPNKPSVQIPPACQVTELAPIQADLEASLQALADELGASKVPPALIANGERPQLPTGAMSQEGIAAVLGALLPEQAIIVDESVSTGRGFARFTENAAPHDWLNLMGGAIGFGLPQSVGAAIAAPDRRVITLEGDGSGMYTEQALWTMARESLNITVLLFANRTYQILRGELANVGAGEPGKRANDMLTLDRPALDWVSLAKGHGVEAGRVTDLDGLGVQMKRALARPGPYLIEVVL